MAKRGSFFPAKDIASAEVPGLRSRRGPPEGIHSSIYNEMPRHLDF